MDLRTASPPLTCAVCRAELEAPWSCCEGCRTALHRDCWEALDSFCPTLGCRAGRRARIRIQLPASRRRRRWPWVVAGLLGVGAAALALSRVGRDQGETIINGWPEDRIIHAPSGPTGPTAPWPAPTFAQLEHAAEIERLLRRAEEPAVTWAEARQLMGEAVRRTRNACRPAQPCYRGQAELIRIVNQAVARLAEAELSDCLEGAPELPGEVVPGIALGMDRTAALSVLGPPSKTVQELAFWHARGLVLRFRQERLIEVRVFFSWYAAGMHEMRDHDGLAWDRLGPATQLDVALAQLGPPELLEPERLVFRRGGIRLELVFGPCFVAGLQVLVVGLE